MDDDLTFEEKIERGLTLEPSDDLTEEYRELLAALVQFTANTELMGAWTERPWIPKAPPYTHRLAIVAKIQDQLGHAQMQYRLVEDLTGRTRNELLADLFEGRSGFGNAFQYGIESWAEYGVFTWLIDGGAMTLQHSLLKTNYGPYARVMRRICREEEFHIRYAGSIVREVAGGSAADRERLQALIDEWWPRGMLFFGHKDGESRTAERMIELGIRTRSNDELRQDYLDNFVPKIRDLGLEVPDDGVEYDEAAERWHYSEPDWTELERNKQGRGPVAGARLESREAAFEDTAWVREALAAHHRRHAQGRMDNSPAPAASGSD